LLEAGIQRGVLVERIDDAIGSVVKHALQATHPIAFVNESDSQMRRAKKDGHVPPSEITPSGKITLGSSPPVELHLSYRRDPLGKGM
jgi:hypothetical protein